MGRLSVHKCRLRESLEAARAAKRSIAEETEQAFLSDGSEEPELVSEEEEEFIEGEPLTLPELFDLSSWKDTSSDTTHFKCQRGTKPTRVMEWRHRRQEKKAASGSKDIRGYFGVERCVMVATLMNIPCIDISITLRVVIHHHR